MPAEPTGRFGRAGVAGDVGHPCWRLQVRARILDEQSRDPPGIPQGGAAAWRARGSSSSILPSFSRFPLALNHRAKATPCLK